MLNRNVAIKVNTFVKLALHNSFILRVLLYSFKCLTAGRTEIQILENSKNVVKWITGKKIQNKNPASIIKLIATTNVYPA